MIEDDLCRVSEKIRKSKRFFIFIHSSADGDCTASSLAMWYSCTRGGKEAYIFTDDIEKFDEQRKKILRLSAQCEIFMNAPVFLSIKDCKAFAESGIVMMLDFNSYERAGKLAGELRELVNKNGDENLLVIDHHFTASSLSPYSLIDSELSSATELCYDVIKKSFDFKIDRALSDVLFFGIASDSGFFKFVKHKRGADTFRKVADLIENGTEPDVVSASLSSGRLLSSNDYLVYLLQNTKFVSKGRVALCADNKEMFESCGYASRPSDEYYSLMLSLKGVEAVVFLKYTEDENVISASVRVCCFSQFNASLFCNVFSGGGHIKAAGFLSKNISMNELHNKIEIILENSFDEYTKS